MSLTTLFVRMIITSCEVINSNLPAEHKRMQKFTEVANGEKETISCVIALFVRMIKVMK